MAEMVWHSQLKSALATSLQAARDLMAENAKSRRLIGRMLQIWLNTLGMKIMEDNPHPNEAAGVRLQAALDNMMEAFFESYKYDNSGERGWMRRH